MPDLPKLNTPFIRDNPCLALKTSIISPLIRSSINLVSKLGQSSETKVKNLKRHYIRDRMKYYWNKLPNDIKNASSLNIFKNSLDNYKNDCLSSGFYTVGNYWDLSCEILNHIEDNSDLDNKQLFNEYLRHDNPFVAQKKFTNIH